MRTVQSKRGSAKEAPPQVYVPFLPLPADEETEDTIYFFTFLFKAIVLSCVLMLIKESFDFLVDTIQHEQEKYHQDK
jgi:hypothetical protein